ncbi:MAG: dUTP diphosphatase [Clostridia bacterium]|nr:dUTP diphosphatase [Clostridia bacterium]
MNMKISLQKLHPQAVIPTFGSEQAAGADLYALLDEPATIQPGETLLIKTGVAMAIPDGYVGLIFARSGLASKRGLAPANKVGVIDSDYRGELMVALHNHSAQPQTVEPKERIAQLAILPYLHPTFEVAESLDETKRGDGGFGSTGTK